MNGAIFQRVVTVIALSLPLAVGCAATDGSEDGLDDDETSEGDTATSEDRLQTGLCTTGSATDPQVKNVILRVFGGGNGPGALRVAKCESGGAGTNARNGQYLGLFQMGSGERGRFGHSACAETQAAAAFKYFQQRGWGPWSCKP